MNWRVPVTGFKSVFNFGATRSWWAAVGFYFFHLFFSAIIAGFLTMLLKNYYFPTPYTSMDPGQQFDENFRRGMATAAHFSPYLSAIYCTGLYALIIRYRQAWTNPRYLLALLGTLIISPFAAIFGLLPAAVTLGLKPRSVSGSKRHD